MPNRTVRLIAVVVTKFMRLMKVPVLLPRCQNNMLRIDAIPSSTLVMKDLLFGHLPVEQLPNITVNQRAIGIRKLDSPVSFFGDVAQPQPAFRTSLNENKISNALWKSTKLNCSHATPSWQKCCGGASSL